MTTAILVPGAARAVGWGSPIFVPANAGGTNSVVTADVNGDLKADLIASNDSGRISTMLGLGGNAFQAGSTTQVSVGITSDLAVGLVDGDTRPDVVASNNSSDTVVVLHGNGDGTFFALAPLPVGARPSGIALADVNNDGKLDILTSNWASNNVSFLMNFGGGSFGPQVTYPVGAGPLGLVVADFNGDGNPDVATANSTANSVSILLGNGGGTFGPAVSTVVGLPVMRIAAGRLNADAFVDLAVASSVSSGQWNIVILTGNGIGGFTFLNQLKIPGVSGGSDVAIGDLNGDGKMDLAGVNAGTNLANLFYNDGTANFFNGPTPATHITPVSVITTDLNGDGAPDIAAANLSSNDVSVNFGVSPPTVPLNVLATAGHGSITLTWDAPASGNATSYNVYSGPFSGSETLLATPTAPTYTQTGLGDGATRFYRVSAVNAGGEGPLSAEVSATTFTLPTAPLNLTAAPGTGVGDIALAWQVPADAGGTTITGYVLCRRAGNGPQFCGTIGAGTSVTDSGLLPLTKYSYTLAAVNVVGQGPATSPEVCAKPFPWVGALGC